MSTFANSPQLIKGGLVVLDVVSGAFKRTIALQYNPDSLTWSYQVQGAGVIESQPLPLDRSYPAPATNRGETPAGLFVGTQIIGRFPRKNSFAVRVGWVERSGTHQRMPGGKVPKASGARPVERE